MRGGRNRLPVRSLCHGGPVMDDLSRFCCQNSECPDYGKRGSENLSVCGCYGSNKQWRMLRCRTCKARFSERKGTPLFGSALPEEKVRSILEHVAEGCGVRETGRLVGVHRDTVMRYSRLAGEPRSPTPRRTCGRFPPRPGKCSSTKSGPSWEKRKSTAIRPTPTTPSRAITGTTWRWTPNIAWW